MTSSDCGAEVFMAGSHKPNLQPAGTSLRKLSSNRFHSDPTVMTLKLDDPLPERRPRSRLPHHLRPAEIGTPELESSDLGTASASASNAGTASGSSAGFKKPTHGLLRKLSSVSSMSAVSSASSEAGGFKVLGDARSFFKRMGTKLLPSMTLLEGGRRASAFENSSELKEKITDIIDRTNTTRDVKDLYKSTGLARQVAHSGRFQTLSLLLVVAYAGWVAVDAEFNDADTLDKADPVFQVAEHTFCLLFTLELLVRFCALRSICLICYDSWLLFDGTLVTLMVAETWLIPIILAIAVPDGDGLPNTSWVRLLRLVRLARLARTARLVNAFPELKVMIKGMLASLRSVLVTGLLLLLVLYVFGIGLKQTSKGTTGGETYFGSVPRAMYSLMLHATFMDGPSMVLDELDTISRVLFLVALVLSAMLLLNMLIGVMCEAVSNISSMEKERMQREKMTEKVKHLLCHSNLDLDSNGRISKTELLSLLEDPNAAKVLHDAGVDMVGLLDVSDLIFQSDSLGQEFNKELDFKEFMEVLLALRGENTATVRDIVDFKKVINTHFTQVSNDLAKLEASIPKAVPSSRQSRATTKQKLSQKSSVLDPPAPDPIANGQLRRIKMLQKSFTHDSLSVPGMPDNPPAMPLEEPPDEPPQLLQEGALCNAASAADDLPLRPSSGELTTIIEGLRETGTCGSLLALSTASDLKSDDEDKLSSDRESLADAPGGEDKLSSDRESLVDAPGGEEPASGSSTSSQELAIQRIESCLAALQQELVVLKRGTRSEPKAGE
eukprot:TRINITY_DN6079_c0_g1_i2.p1 TRINITY_DN6079_c0_g1~~TRINITY_DN6079_c0_g1_i2.p1  ORF type:complete len:781 (-),score=162.96 TRINITY_DN6079_c0_g1_i2:207-2549(-)